MNVTLKSISLNHFKGIKSFKAEFNGSATIKGENGTGKTTIFDAFLWCFFGKDSHDQKDFEVKTLNPDNTPVHNLDHEVEVSVLVDGQEKIFKRTLREKWVKKRGEETPEMQGHETFFWINGVPYQANEYKNRVNEVIPEAVFKLVSSPSYFNSIPWKERRNILTSIAGVIPEPDGYDYIKEKIKEIGLEVFKREISAKKKLLKGEIELIPARIDEISRSESEPVNAQEISRQIEDATKRIEFVNSKIMDASKRFNARNQNNLLKQRDIHEMKVRLQNIQLRVEDLNRNAGSSVSQKKSAAETAKSRAVSEIANINQDIQRKIISIDITNKEIAALREEWRLESEKQFISAETSDICPIIEAKGCSQFLANIESKRTELIEKFNQKKVEALASINRDGQGKNEIIKRLTAEIETLKASIAPQEAIIKESDIAIQEAISTPISVRDYTKEPDYIETLAKIEAVVFEEITPEDTSALTSEISLLQAKIEAARKLLTLHEVSLKNTERTNELRAREKQLAQMIAELEKTEFQIEGYTRGFMTEVETKVNSMFTMCKFKLFTVLINGGVEECCETLVNGIPYSSNLNSAARTNAGLDIINVLSAYHNVSVPVFVDNREGVNELIPTNSQVINLVVSNDQVLTVYNN